MRSLCYLKWRFANVQPDADFQIPLESDRAFFISEVQKDNHVPRSMRRGVGAAARIVRGQSYRNVRRQASVVATNVSLTLQDVHRSHPVHAAARCKMNADARAKIDGPILRVSNRREGETDN